MKGFTIFGFLMVVVLLAGCASTGGADKLTAEDLFDQFVEAAYGSDGMSAHSSITMSGTLIIDDFGLEGPVKTKQMAPDYFLADTEVMGMNITQGCKADLCWDQQPGQSAQRVQGPPLAILSQQADFFQWENMDKYYDSLEVVVPAEDDASRYHKVRAVRANGDEDFYYFSKETGLLAGSELMIHSPQGSMRITSRLNNYREFGSMLVPTETVQETPMATIKIVVDEVSFAPLSESDFPVPQGL
ncbi:MAG: hypothetical protein WDZ30_07460 [Cellvibrionaceae bacterium]